MLCIISLYINILFKLIICLINILFKLIICLYICIYLCIFVYLCICVYICVHFCIFVYISVYSHLSPKDAPRDLLQNERLESFWGGLWLELWPFLYFHQLFEDMFNLLGICWDLFGPRLSQDTYLKKMRSAICYKMNVSRASGAACGSSYGRFCIFIWVENVSTADSDRGRLVLSFGSKKRR